jgi:hypothetical protein
LAQPQNSYVSVMYLTSFPKQNCVNKYATLFKSNLLL